MITVLELLQTTTAYLEKHGVESPRLNIEHLLAHCLGLKRIELYLQFDRPLSEKELKPLRESVRKRAQGIPLQHLLGTVEFHGRTFKSDPRALIPRPETEHLIELIQSRLKTKPPQRIVDIGTGSGVIAITLALSYPEAQVFGLDISPDALSLARENAESLSAPVTWLESNLLTNLREDAFDLVVANLPYIPTSEIATLSREVKQDPILALDGGNDGLDLIRSLLSALPDRIQSGGMVALEIGHGQGYALNEFLLARGFGDVSVVKDYQGFERFVFATYG